MRVIFKCAHGRGFFRQYFEASGRNANHALHAGMNDVAWTNDDTANFHRLTRGAKTQGAMMNGGPSPISRKGDGWKRLQVPRAPIGYHAHATRCVKHLR